MNTKDCFHCGDQCPDNSITVDDKYFCCHGCKTVFDILNDNGLAYYYDLENTPGTTPATSEGKFDFLENETIAQKLLDFNEQGTQVVSLLIPAIHCSSCIWVLENLNRLHPAVKTSQVHFSEKKVRITFSSEEISLHQLVILLSRIGYEPYISLDDTSEKKPKVNRALIYKIGVAGFAFGNIMFLSFPEYFEVSEFWLEKFKHVFRWLMFVFSLPVVFYSGSDYLIAAYKGLRSKVLNIDVPISIGIIVLFVRSTLEIVMDWGTGFFDSLAGLIFFLLLGKFFQQKTYAFLSFERDYKSYFPIGVTRLDAKDNKLEATETQVQVNELKKGDRILIRNGELIPVDGVLIKGSGLIDYSFVTGEAAPLDKNSGDLLFAGGRQTGGAIEVEVVKAMEQSYLTQLWSNQIFQENRLKKAQSLTDFISKRFTISILIIAFLVTAIWLIIDPSKALNVFTAILIVACPCAIALAAPFTLGNLLRIYGKQKLYLKDSATIERMAAVNTIVFDKTGTLTNTTSKTVVYEGVELSEEEATLLTSTLRASNHPLSRTLYSILQHNAIKTLDEFNEEVGKGITGTLNNKQIKVGSYGFVDSISKEEDVAQTAKQTCVHISTNNEYKGCYVFYNEYREGVTQVINALAADNEIIILSGDNDGEKKYLTNLLPSGIKMHFNQKPESKLNFVKQLQEQGKKVMMVGDGLNDAGALAQSDVGIAISENINVFSPACDGILDASKFKNLKQFITLSKSGIKTIKYAFIFSLFYNLIGLGFAVTGNLSPIVAAILMPLSSISIVVFTTLATQLISAKLKS